MKIKYYGHSCLEIIIAADCKILIDPFISPNPLAGKIDVDNLAPSHVFITHGHEDHVADAVKILKSSNAELISNFEICNWFGEKGVANLKHMNQGGSYKCDKFQAQYVNAVHSSSMPDGSYGGQAGGFIFKSGETCFYHAGDTALMQDFKLFGKLNDIDCAALPIGDCFTMGAREAAIAAQMLKTKRVIGIHYDTFPPIEIDKVEAKAQFAKVGVELLLLEIGTSVEL